MRVFKPQLFAHYPSGFTPLFFTQILFNFGFYGFKSLFLLYAIKLLALMEHEAIAFFTTFMSLTYATSLAGGILADKVIGAKNSLIIGGILCCTSTLMLLLSPRSTVYIAMALLSVGLGCVKPNLSTILSMLFKDLQDPRKDDAFTTFYVAMNIGNFLGPLVCSFTSRAYGWRYGVGLILICFLGGALLFLWQSKALKNLFKNYKAYDIGKALFILMIIALSIYYLFKSQVYFHGLMGLIIMASIISCGVIFFKATSQERQGLLKAIVYILLFTIFCALYEQSGSSLILFFDHFIDRNIFDITLPSSTLLSMNPILILALGILIPFIGKKFQSKRPTLQGFTKFSIGFFLTSLSFSTLALASYQDYIPLSILWMISAITLQTIAELFIVPVGFANISKLVTQRYIGFMMGLWLMGISYGHYLAGLFARFSLNATKEGFKNPLENYFHFFMNLSTLSLIIGLLLVFLIFIRKPKC